MKHLESKHINPEWAKAVFERTRELKAGKQPQERLKRKVMVLCFFEDSTRTKLSFQLAAQRLGITVLDLNPKSSSLSKGESYGDTLRTVQAMGADIIVIRTTDDDFIERHFDEIRISMISGGQGQSDHPSQALLDAFTVYEYFEGSRNNNTPRVTLVGDIKHSRVAKSDVDLFQKCGIEVALCGPEELLPASDYEGVKRFQSLSEAAENSDFLMGLRIQNERLDSKHMTPERAKEIIKDYQISYKIFNHNSKLKILHPGPVNWGVELCTSIRDHGHSLIETQVRNGVYVRMALLEKLLINE